MLIRMFQLFICMTFIIALELVHAIFDRGIFALMLLVNFTLQFIREVASKSLFYSSSPSIPSALRCGWKYRFEMPPTPLADSKERTRTFTLYTVAKILWILPEFF